MTSVSRVRKWREKKAKQGGRNLAVWLDQETGDLFEDLRQTLKEKNADIVARAIKELHTATCNNKKPVTKPKGKRKKIREKTGSALFMEVSERYVARTPMKKLKPDLIKAFSKMLIEGYDPGEIKKILVQHNLPTVSGKPRWTLAEIRKLARYM